MNKDNIQKYILRVYYNYKVGDKVMLNNKYAYKYKNRYNGSFEIMQCWKNGMFTFKIGTTKVMYNTFCIKPYTSKSMLMMSICGDQVYTSTHI